MEPLNTNQIDADLTAISAIISKFDEVPLTLLIALYRYILDESYDSQNGTLTDFATICKLLDEQPKLVQSLLIKQIIHTIEKTF